MREMVTTAIALTIVSLCSAQHPSSCKIQTMPNSSGMSAGGSACLVAAGEGVGLVLTAEHVIAGSRVGDAMRLYFPGRSMVVGALCAGNRQSDAALVMVDEADIQGLDPVPWFEGTVPYGMPLYSDGWPSGRYSRIRGGVIATTDNGFAFRTTAVPWEGHSGGPVFSMDNRILGLVSARYGNAEGGIVYRVGPIRKWILGLAWPVTRKRSNQTGMVQVQYCPGGGCEVIPYGGQGGGQYGGQRGGQGGYGGQPYGGSRGRRGGNPIYVEPPIGVNPDAKPRPSPEDQAPTPAEWKQELDELRKLLEEDRQKSEEERKKSEAERIALRKSIDNSMNLAAEGNQALRESIEATQNEQKQYFQSLPQYVTPEELTTEFDQRDESIVSSMKDEMAALLAAKAAAEATKAVGLPWLGLPASALTALGIGGLPAAAILLGAWMIKRRPIRRVVRRRRRRRDGPFEDTPAPRRAGVSPDAAPASAGAGDYDVDELDEDEEVEEHVERRPAVVERPFRRRVITTRGPERVIERQTETETRQVSPTVRRTRKLLGNTPRRQSEWWRDN